MQKRTSKSKDSREVIVFVHYFGGSATSWDWVIEKLSPDYHCIAITLPGFGTLKPLKNPSIQAFAKHVHKELIEKGIKKYSLAGHSMGAKIALQIAANVPAKTIQQLILIAPSPPTFELISNKDKERMLHHRDPGAAEKIIKMAVKKSLSDAQYQMALKDQLDVDANTWRWWIEEGVNHSIANEIHHLDMPVTVLTSKDDPVMTPDVIRNQVIPYVNNARLVETKGFGHFGAFEAPDWIAQQIRISLEDNNQTNDTKPTLSYWHVWTDDNGVSHQTKALLTSFKKESISGAIDPQWNDRLFQSKSEILFSEQPVGWLGDWHENPKPQWIVPLSGKWFVETMDGHRVEMGPGEVSFGGDQHTKKDDEGRKGHLSGTVGKNPAQLMIIQLLDVKWKGAKPGAFE